ncbi:MAG: CBS domain-containing protein [Candidatus Rokubacteria bacterium]|nr:CBS domain-containing protein [Candidatus Rokubacteria bacterium]
MHTVEEIMTRDVIAVAPDTTIHAVARLLVDHGISGVPVVDDQGAVVGILSEGDLIVRQKARPRPPWWALFLSDGEQLARDYQKAMGTTVAEVMTRPVISVRPSASIGAAAALLDRHRVRRLPVLDEGRLVGIVSRGDLVKALAMGAPDAAEALSDAQRVEEMKARMDREPWTSSRGILIEAREGGLVLWGMVDSEAERSALETMARAIPGCRRVDNQILVRVQLLTQYGAV